MKRLLLILAVALGFALPSFAQQIVDVHQMGDKIVIEYDLSQPAEFVRLYVSTDGGTTYRGPLKQVEGDVKDVASGYNRSITWDVLKEFSTFESDNVKFKLSIKLKEKWHKETFITANVAYSFAPQLSFGFSVGQVKHFGWFVSAMTNGGFTGMGNLPKADAQGFVEGGYLPMYNGQTTTDRLSIIAGGMIRVAEPLCIRVGAGYGVRNLCWQDTNGQWYKMKDNCVQGVDVSAGLQLHLSGFVVSAEAVTTNFQPLEAKLGLGYAW